MRQFNYRVAIRVPDASRDAANQAVANITGNPVDLQTFSARITNGSEVQYVSEVWMRAQYFDLLDDFRAQLGGNYAVMARRVDGRWVKLGDIWSWLDSSGYRMTEADE